MCEVYIVDLVIEVSYYAAELLGTRITFGVGLECPRSRTPTLVVLFHISWCSIFLPALNELNFYK